MTCPTRTLLATFVLALGLAHANPALAATVYQYSYTTIGGNVLAGTLTGVLQGDNDTVLVTAFDSPTFNGNPTPAIVALTSLSDFFFSSGVPPTLSLSGNIMDFLAGGDPGYTDGISIESAGYFSGLPRIVAGPSYGNLLEDFNSANWSMSEASSVPAPAALPGGLATLALGVLRRSRQRRHTAA
jgi:hypothetical protein